MTRPTEAAERGFDTMGAVRGHLLLTNCVEDVKEFHQRPKIEDYDDFVSIVAYGARGLGEPMTEVHCFYFYAERFLVSVHRDEVPAVAEACTATCCPARSTRTCRWCPTGSTTCLFFMPPRPP